MVQDFISNLRNLMRISNIYLSSSFYKFIVITNCLASFNILDERRISNSLLILTWSTKKIYSKTKIFFGIILKNPKLLDSKIPIFRNIGAAIAAIVSDSDFKITINITSNHFYKLSLQFFFEDEIKKFQMTFNIFDLNCYVGMFT